MFRKWIVRGVIAAALAASSAMGITNIPAGASTGYDVTYTTDADFDGGTLFNVNHNAPNNNQLQLNTNITTFTCPHANACGSQCPTFKRRFPFTGTFYAAVYGAPSSGCAGGGYRLIVTTKGGATPTLVGDNIDPP